MTIFLPRAPHRECVRLLIDDRLCKQLSIHIRCICSTMHQLDTEHPNWLAFHHGFNVQQQFLIENMDFLRRPYWKSVILMTGSVEWNDSGVVSVAFWLDRSRWKWFCRHFELLTCRSGRTLTEKEENKHWKNASICCFSERKTRWLKGFECIASRFSLVFFLFLPLIPATTKYRSYVQKPPTWTPFFLSDELSSYTRLPAIRKRCPFVSILPKRDVFSSKQIRIKSTFANRCLLTNTFFLWLLWGRMAQF